MVQVRDPRSSPRVVGRKREILRAASEIFRERGFHDTGMRDIAARLGIAVGKLYYYFRSKQDLLAFCQLDTLERLRAMARRMGEWAGPGDQRLWLMILGHVRCLNEGTLGSLAHLEIGSLDGGMRRRICGLRDEYERAFREMIAAAMTEGTLRQGDPKLAALAILGATNWTALWYRPEGRVTARAVGRAFAEHLVRGLLPDGATLGTPDPAQEALLDDDDEC